MTYVILLVLLIIIYFVWRNSQKQNSSSSGVSVEFEGIGGEGWWENRRKEEKIYSNQKFLDEETLKKEFESKNRKKISQTHTRKTIEVFKGYDFKPNPDLDEWEYWEGYYNEWRKDICSNEELITEFEMWNYCRNYFSVDQSNLRLTIEELLDSRGQIKFELLKIMRDEFFKSWKNKYYDKETKTWEDFDVNGIYLQTRGLMVGKKDFSIPNYVWLMDDRPFIYSYRLTRDYMKWKGTKRVTNLVFDNVVKWETGTIFKENERETKELYNPLWVDWNNVGKDLLLMKTKLKKEDKEGYDWLKTDVKDYINSRVSFYQNLGETSKYKINDELLSKFEKLK
jgi:hypothetical protein